MNSTTLKLTASADHAHPIRDVAALVGHAETLGFTVEVRASDDARGRLVLTVREDEPVTVGDAAVTIVELGTRKARVMFEAPRATTISRHTHPGRVADAA